MTAELAHLPRYDPQIVKALALLAAKTDLWEARRQTGPLHDWWATRERGETPRPEQARAWREFDDTVEDAATVLRLRGPDTMP